MRKKTARISVFMAALAIAASASACTPTEKKVSRKVPTGIETSAPIQVSKEKNKNKKELLHIRETKKRNNQ